MPIYTGSNGNDVINGSNDADIIFALAGNDTIRGRRGDDTIFGGNDDDDISGGDDNDALHGEAGNDSIEGGDGNDRLTGGGGFDYLHGGFGTDTAVYSGSIFEYEFAQGQNYLIVSHLGGAGADGIDVLQFIERLEFADATVDLTQNNAPIARDDSAATDEDAGTYSSGSASVLDNDFDFEGNMSVTPAVSAGAYGTLTMNGDGTYSYALDPAAQALAQGASAQDSFDYTVTDGSLSDTGTLTITVTGINDAPVANDDVSSTTENSAILVDVTTNDTDVDNGADLTLTGASAPAGQGSASVVSGQVQFDPGTDFDDLAAGATEQVLVSYEIADEHGATAAGTLTITVTGTNDGPVANPDTDTTDENSAVTLDVLANDTDVDNGAVLTVTAASAPAGQGSASVVANQVQFDPGTDFDDLAIGESVEVIVGYDIEDEHGAAASSAITITVTGLNDVPVANGDTASIGENGAAILVDVLANDSDADNGAVVTLTAATAPAGQGSASVVNGQVQFDPVTDFDDLAAGETEEVIVSYDIEDEHGATATGTLTVTVTGANDAPVENPDADTTHEDVAITIDALANDTDVDNGAVLTITAASVTAGEGTVSIVDNKIRYNPSPDLDYLADGESLVVVINYTLKDEHGVQSSSTVTVTVEGETDGSITGTNDGETITGTPDDDRINALGGDDTVFALAGNDFVRGGDGSDTLNGEGGNDLIEGGNDGDIVSGGDGFDNLDGEAGNDSISGGNDGDVLSGGDGDDSLSGDAGDDGLQGDDGHDQLSGGDGLDVLSGGTGNDTVAGGNDDDVVSGGDGDDTLTGGGGNDILSDLSGTNSLSGGLDNDQIEASSLDGAQTIDGGSGSDNIRHYYRHYASTITTGDGSDTIEILNADQGAEAIKVTDFTAGAGGDVFRLEGDAGSLLGLLIGWDGSSNPFGSGFLRLTQSGDDTLLEWDRDGEATELSWQTLVIFQNNVVANFTDANFSPAYHPNGSAPAGQTINGTNGSETLNGTIGDDTINAFAGNDTVNGNAGADLINGGDGADQLNGQADNDIIDGGNEDDIIFGGDGNDQLSGQAGHDIVFGGNGDDTVSGGAGDDSLDGVAGDDTLSGGDGNDILNDVVGTNSLSGGLGDDQIRAGSADGAQTIDGGDGADRIRHYFRHFASTITAGLGVDSIEIAYADQGSEAIIVTDFTPGAGGDVFRLSGEEGSLLSLLVGWDGTSNPFGTFLRLHQEGANVQLEWDQDGEGEGAGWQTLVIFQNTDFDDFTADNFDPAYPPGGDPPAGETITGTNEDDFLVGTIGDDTIDALGGSDNVFGLDGADIINGGSGFDNLDGGAGNDVIDGGGDDDFLTGGEGNDQMLGQGGGDVLFGDSGDDVLTGGAGFDSLVGDSGDDTLSGGDDSDVLSGGADSDSLNGGAGDDFLSGGSGSDVMTGGIGFDTFDFQSPSDGPDQVTDFLSRSDQIQVSAEGFGGGLVAGGTVSFVSGTDPTATEANGQFLYDTDDGNLYWDVDGTGAEAAVLVATFSNLPALDAVDFIVV